jgi:hypothetical protein
MSHKKVVILIAYPNATCFASCMSKESQFEQSNADITEVRDRIVQLYLSLHLLNFTTKPPIFSPDQAATPDIVYHALPNRTSIHIGQANAKNTPAALHNWHGGSRTDLILWHNRHQRNGTVTTPYYLGATIGDISTPFIVTPKDEKRFRLVSPNETENGRWQSLMQIVLATDQLELPRPKPPRTELTA